MIRLSILILAALLTCACTAVDMDRMQGELGDLYRAKLAIESAASPLDQASDGIYLRFLDLAKRAQSAANSLSRPEDERNRVTFRYIAATALWQSGQSGYEALRSTGESLDGWITGAARDCINHRDAMPTTCAYLDALTNVAEVDAMIRGIDALRRSLGPSPITERDLRVLAARRQTLLLSLERVSSSRPKIAESNASDDVLKWIDRQLLRGHCGARSAKLAISTPNQSSLSTSLTPIESKLVRDAGLSALPNTLDCRALVATRMDNVDVLWGKMLGGMFDGPNCANIQATEASWKRLRKVEQSAVDRDWSQDTPVPNSGACQP